MYRQKNWFRWFGGIPLFAALCSVQNAYSVSGDLTGSVKSWDGKPLEGVAVSARAHDKTFTTTVYSDLGGLYLFPPLEDGRYRVWAQAVGWEGGSFETEISAGKKTQQNFTLKELKDFSMQLSGTEWMMSLPVDTPHDRRMKILFRHNCASCHVASFVLQNRFDASGWGKVLNLMSRIGIYDLFPNGPAGLPANQVVNVYKEELVEYLTRVRGPNPYPLKFKLFPRPTGEAAQIVVTEYDISPGDRSGYLSNDNGSDWSQGTPSHYEGRSIHDLAVDNQGYVWFGNTVPHERTLSKLNPRTGQVTNYKLPGRNGEAIRGQGLVVDRDGNIWFTSGSPEGALVKFDPRVEKFQQFPRPDTFPPMGPFVVLDSKGNLWNLLRDGGATKFDPRTGKYAAYKEKPDKNEKPGVYGLSVDSEDNIWYTHINSDRVGTVDSRSGEVSVLTLNPLRGQFSDKDRKVGENLVWRASDSPLYIKGPRRLAADRGGESVWVPDFWEGILEKIDINTRKVTEYQLPYPHSTPYTVTVDKNHMVWINLMNSDRVAKFNPFTESFTEYPLPTLGTEARHIAVDDSTDPPTVWVPYYRTNKIARLQFRTASAGPLAAGGRE